MELNQNIFGKTDDNIHDHSKFIVPNAGMVILSPYFPLLFTRMRLLEDDRKKFLTEAASIKAIFAIQGLLYGDRNREFEDCDLFLNKLILKYPLNKVLPRKVELTCSDWNYIDSMIKNVMMNWDKIRNTSEQEFRETFLCRSGIVEEQENAWILKVEGKSFDKLLDSLPWNFNYIKHPWMDKTILVKWQ